MSNLEVIASVEQSVDALQDQTSHVPVQRLAAAVRRLCQVAREQGHQIRLLEGWRDMVDREKEDPVPVVRDLQIVFDGPPGPESGRFLEVEDGTGRSVSAGKWVQRADGHWALQLRVLEPIQ